MCSEQMQVFPIKAAFPDPCPKGKPGDWGDASWAVCSVSGLFNCLSLFTFQSSD